jgi:hypothetical protein
MNRLLPLILVFAVACGGGSTRPTDSGIEGVTVSGPQCPVEFAGSPCPDAPVSARLVITKRGSSDAVATVTTAANGTLRILLAPGAYTIVPFSKTPVPAPPEDVTVRAHRFTRVTIRFDSGIR